MGRLYVGEHGFEFDDRTLAHIRVAFALKLESGTGFFFSWAVSPERGSGRLSVWVSPAVTVVFQFDGSREPAISREWVTRILHSSNGGAGLKLVPEASKPGRSPAGTSPV